MFTIDLHAHTTASDGSLSPTELVNLAICSRLSALAVTDHDTVDGLPEALEAANSTDVELVPGIELAVEFQITMLAPAQPWPGPSLPRFSASM